MRGAPRQNVACVVKTFRFTPQLVNDMEYVIYLTREEDEPKYTSMTGFIVEAVRRLIKQERGELEGAGVVWDHLKPGLKNSIKKGT